MAPVGTGPDQMCAPDVGQGGLQGTKEMWDAAGPAGLGCTLHHGLPPPPQTQAGMGSRCVSWEGDTRRGELSAGRLLLLPPPTPVLPVVKLLLGHQPVHSGASEVPVALRHHETERSLEPRWALQASPGFFPEYNTPCPDV